MKQEWIKNKILVVDELFSPTIAKNYHYTIAQNVSWGGDLASTTSKYKNNDFKNINSVYEQFQLVSVERNSVRKEGMNTDLTHFIYYPLMTWALHYGYSIRSEQISRCKVNLQTRALEKDKNKFNHPHVDVKPDDDKQRFTAIYYVNDSDGHTYFFNEDHIFAEKLENLDKLTLIEKVSPKAGRLVVFPHNLVHAGSHPIESDHRIVINYNFHAENLLQYHKDHQ